MGGRVGFGFVLFTSVLTVWACADNLPASAFGVLGFPTRACYHASPKYFKEVSLGRSVGECLSSPAYVKPWLPSSAPHRTGYGDANLRCLALGRLKWEDLGFEASLGYTRRPSLQNNLNI